MKKRILVLTLMLSMIISMFAGCSKNEPAAADTAESDRISIVTTVFAPYDFTKQITKDKADLTMLLSPGAETHSYEPTPQDIIKISKCDIFIYVGGESDVWVDNVLASIDNSEMKIIKLMDCVDVVEEEVLEGMTESEEHDHGHEGEEHADEHEEDHDHEEAEWDEHVWTSPKNAILISKAIETAVAEKDEANKDFYAANLESYISELTSLDQEFEQVVSTAKRTEVIFGDRFPLRYFVECYGLTYYAAFPGCATDTEPSAATIAFLSDKVKEDQIPVVFKIELSNGNVANTVAEATGAKVMTFYSCHNVTKDDFAAGKTYIDLMKLNVESLKEALN